jgi:hypothetical protein
MEDSCVDGAFIVQPINHKFDHSYVTRYFCFKTRIWGLFLSILCFLLMHDLRYSGKPYCLFLLVQCSVMKRYPGKFVGCCLANPAEGGDGIFEMERLVNEVRR